MIEPPCTTFSVMRRPALRTRWLPFGIDLSDPQTFVGTRLAYRALQVLDFCERHGVSGVVENLWTSKIRFLSGWEILASRENVQLVRCDSLVCLWISAS